MSESEEPAGVTVRRLIRTAERAALATSLKRDGSGWPYASLVLAAADHDGSPLLLLSDLADHSRNIDGDERISLLYDGTAGWRDPLAGPRASVLGRAVRAEDPRLLARFIARHAGAKIYAGFKDFHLYRVQVESAHLVAGFGRIEWLGAAEILLAVAQVGELPAVEIDALSHMNADHGDAIALMACHLLNQSEQGWRLVGIDPEGCDLSREGRLLRLDFEQPVQDSTALRVQLAALAKRAREAATEDQRDVT